eukprot:CAMPEP_0175870558 /NCGR_PEP_ID=MMETSP0107_2-20121207/36631_1 /TAXON_ID=195067 ORGANISM="Goniomonas pacifica, Strain CCMP1869" /NCGR_SAMPLE_ID=MMETSP0107_2 /ASSEMBLY_ACC=CAM_ASM_000203 /LENGTH=41 /DNA_ID= /DNA_START= /DNA_END= /DNA_ORIENTATION=
MTVGLHRPAFELFFERAWLQAWTIWLFEVLPSVTVVLAMGS